MDKVALLLKEDIANYIKDSGEKILSKENGYDEEKFNQLALRLFRYQFENNQIYAKYCLSQKATPENINRWDQIPAMPINVFKHFTLSAVDLSEAETWYVTSGTTSSSRGHHYLDDVRLYNLSSYYGFKNWVMPEVERMPILVLFPSKEELPHSSLAYFLDYLLHTLGSKESAFYIQRDEFLKEKLYEDLKMLVAQNKPVLLAGPSFSFVFWFDFLREENLRLSLPFGSRMLDTGGFKGRTRSITAKEMIQDASRFLGLSEAYVINYYGMTELGSQFYDNRLREYVLNGKLGKVFKSPPPWARVRIVDLLTLKEASKGSEGAIVVYDLSNQNSLFAIRTEDKGVACEDGFKVLGRLPKSEERGCSRSIEAVLTKDDSSTVNHIASTKDLWRPQRSEKQCLEAFWLPQESFEERVQIPSSTIPIEVPYLSKEGMRNILSQLEKTLPYLRGLKVIDIAQRIEKAVRLWQTLDSEFMLEALRVIPCLTGYATSQVAKALEHTLNQLTAKNLISLLDSEIGSYRYLDGFNPYPGGELFAKGPGLTFAVFSGNVPGIAFSHIAHSLLLKGCLLGKISREEPYSAILFCHALYMIDPELARCVAFTWWPGGLEELEEEIFSQADAVIAYGGDQAVHSYKKRAPQEKVFLGYSHRYSFAVIGEEMLEANRVSECVIDIVKAVDHLQQQGCVSPQMIFAETKDKQKLLALGRELHEKLNLQSAHMTNRYNLPQISAMRRVLDQFELHRLKGEPMYLFGQPIHPWLVIVNRSEKEIKFEDSWAVLGKVIWIQSIDHLENVPNVLSVPKEWLQSVGMAVSKEREEHLAQVFAEFGVTRISPISKMQWPNVFWHHDGRPQIHDLIRWVDKE